MAEASAEGQASQAITHYRLLTDAVAAAEARAKVQASQAIAQTRLVTDAVAALTETVSTLTQSNNSLKREMARMRSFQRVTLFSPRRYRRCSGEREKAEQPLRAPRSQFLSTARTPHTAHRTKTPQQHTTTFQNQIVSSSSSIYIFVNKPPSSHPPPPHTPLAQ